MGLLGVLLTVFLLSAFGLALVMTAIGDSLSAGNVRAGREVFYAADAGLERALLDLQRVPDWDLVLSGAVTSGFADGPPSGPRTLPGGTALVLEEVVNLANCGRRTACDEAAVTAVSEDRPWGADNPRWRLFAWGPFSSLDPGRGVPAYLVVMVADDPLDGDNDPSRDAPAPSAGTGVVLLRAAAYGASGASRAIEATVARSDRPPPAAGYAGQRGGSGATTGAPGAGVQVPGGSLGRTEMPLNPGETSP
ncbi:MAG TPA: pilus assembly PilX N-terminal domain-containing protein [Vicinamibacterales bacterium]|nr:pilus assembly PilX N-terminal domain-containing protein [Vicinamibacterales bacterium]